MVVTSKFEFLYVVRNAFVPLLCFVAGLFLGINSLVNHRELKLVLLLSLLLGGGLVALYNINSVYKIHVTETAVYKTYLLWRKQETIAYELITRVDKKFVSGLKSKSGSISDGYYTYIFYLKNGTELSISPLNYENYAALVLAINENRKKLSL